MPAWSRHWRYLSRANARIALYTAIVSAVNALEARAVTMPMPNARIASDAQSRGVDADGAPAFLLVAWKIFHWRMRRRSWSYLRDVASLLDDAEKDLRRM